MSMTGHTAREQVRLIYELNGEVVHTEYRYAGEPLGNLYAPVKPYHTFDSWGNVPSHMPPRDLTLKGTMRPLLFRAVFCDGVEQYGVFDLPYGAPLEAPPPPTREGCDFIRWDGYSHASPFMPPENREFQAIFEPRSYQVVYEVGEEYRAVFSCRYGDPYPQVETPKKAYHTFSGWSVHPLTIPARDTIITGSFTVNRYHLVRMVDGEVFSDEWLPYGAKIDKTKKPQKEGYYFSGWRKLPATMPGENLTVIATMYPTRYRVDYILAGEHIECKYIPFGDPVPLPSDAEQTREKRGVVWEKPPATMPAHNLELHGNIPVPLYSLVYMAEGEEVYRTDLPAGSSLPQNVTPPQRDGVVFRGWKDEPDAMPSANLVLEASYAESLQHYLFVIDGTTYAERDFAEGETLKFPKPPVKEGAIFSGWISMVTDPDTGVITYSGTYGDVGGHLLSFTVRGETVFAQPLAEGQPIVPPVLSSDPTYRFEGWEGLPEVMPDHDLTIAAKIHVNRYYLRFSLDGNIIYSMPMKADAQISCPAVSKREGYTFSGWQDVPKSMPPHECVIEGFYEKNIHEVTYVIDGEALHVAMVAYGDPIPCPKAPLKEGLCFVGWELSTDIMPDHDLLVKGAYSSKVCRVNYYVDGLYHSTEEVPAGSIPQLPHIPSEEGEIFRWEDAPGVVRAGNVDVHGGHERCRYTVTYLCDGETLATEEYACGEAIYPAVRAPQKEGCSFLSWLGLPKEMPPHNVMVTPTYSNRYSHITFVLENQVILETDAAVGSATPKPEVPEKVGYRFSGWHNWGEVVPDYNFTVYGTYTLSTYTVTYLFGDKTVAVQEYHYGESIEPPVAPEKPGNVFRGWDVLPTYMPAEDLTVSACYEGDMYLIEYVVDGDVYLCETVAFGSFIHPTPPLEKEGCRFTGWEGLPIFMPDANIRVVGTYVANIHSVTYKVGDMIFRIDTYETGQEIAPPSLPEREHEVFVRWINLPKRMPDYDFTCVAEYADAIRHYSFVLDMNELSSGDLRKGEELPAPYAPHVPGYTFGGWQDYTGVMPGKDVTYTGVYLPVNHLVQFFVDGELVHDALVRRSYPVIPPEIPSKVGYLFSGWDHLPEKMPDHDIEIYGTMVPRNYRLTYIADATAIFDKDVACGTPLGQIEAPHIHGTAWCGWDNEPEKMPPEAVVVTGTYRAETPKYKVLKVGDIFGGVHKARRDKMKLPAAYAVVSGSAMRLIIGNLCYTVDGIGHCIRNGVIIDPDGLRGAIRNCYRDNMLPRTRLTLLFHLSEDCDRVYEGDARTPESLEKVGEAILNGKRYCRFVVLSDNTETGTSRVLVSGIPVEIYESYETVFGSLGIKVADANTLMGGIVSYLASKKQLKQDENQLCLFYLSNVLLTVLLVGGQVASITENRYPYPGALDYLKETENAIRHAQSKLQRLAPDEIISTLIIGGTDYERIRQAKPMAAQLLNREIRGGKFSHGKIIRGLSVLRLRYAEVKARS